MIKQKIKLKKRQKVKRNRLRLVFLLIASLSFPVFALKDPTKPPKGVKISQEGEVYQAGFGEGDTQALILKGVFQFKHKPRAVINGQTVAIGDMILGRKVVKIDKTRVVLDESGTETVLPLIGGDVRKVDVKQLQQQDSLKNESASSKYGNMTDKKSDHNTVISK